MRKSAKRKGPLTNGRADEDYTAYQAAFDRLLMQDPDNEALRELLEETGRVPVTQDNVAKEAGLTRKALAAGGRFEELGQRIKGVRSSHGVKPSTTAQLGQLQSDLAEAKQMVVVLRSKAAEAIIKADRAESLLAEERSLSTRLRQQLAGAMRGTAGKQPVPRPEART